MRETQTSLNFCEYYGYNYYKNRRSVMENENLH